MVLGSLRPKSDESEASGRKLVYCRAAMPCDLTSIPIPVMRKMQRLIVSVFGLFAVSCVSVGGTVATPTALENQLLGVYQDLDDDLVYASSVRGGKTSPPSKLDDLRTRVMNARSLQLFNEDELSELKDARCVAETLGARVIPYSCELENGDDASFEKRRIRLLRDENAARQLILEWAAFTVAQKRGRQSIDIEELAKMRRTYFKLLREVAQPKHLFELEKGVFVGAKE